jgi:starch phosphorylase
MLWSCAMEPEPTVAYFSMEIGLDPAVPTYSGGLGVLAGDSLRAAAEPETHAEAANEAPTFRLIANLIATPEGPTASQVSVFEAAENTFYWRRTVR